MLFSKFGRQNADDEYLNKMKQHKWQQDNAYRCRVVKKYFGEIPASPPIAKFTQNIAKMKGLTYQQAQDRVPQARLQKTWNVPAWGTVEKFCHRHWPLAFCR